MDALNPVDTGASGICVTTEAATPMTDNLVGTFSELPFPSAREVGIDTVRIGMARHHIPVLAEIDVTLARAAITKRKEATGEGLSFTGWVIKCLAQAASEHKRVHALRRGRHRLVIFDDVDVAIVVQRRLKGTDPPEYLPMPYVIRKANEKTVEAIHAEIRARQELATGAQVGLAELRSSAQRARRVRQKDRLNVAASRSTRGSPPGPGSNTPAGRTAGLSAENRWWLRRFWHDDSECLHRRRRQRDRLAAPAGTGPRPGRVRGRRGGARLRSRQWIPRRGPADRWDLD